MMLVLLAEEGWRLAGSLAGGHFGFEAIPERWKVTRPLST